jgi:hypothetical protein
MYLYVYIYIYIYIKHMLIRSNTCMTYADTLVKRMRLVLPSPVVCEPPTPEGRASSYWYKKNVNN